MFAPHSLVPLAAFKRLREARVLQRSRFLIKVFYASLYSAPKTVIMKKTQKGGTDHEKT
jgi:hypothetical protein